MSGFCGWIGMEVGDPGSILKPMADRLPPGGAGSRIARPNAGLALSAQDRTGSCAEDGRLISVIEGYPRWDDGTLAEEAREYGQAKALLAAYRRHGSSLLERLKGAFALAVLETDSGDGLLAIDRMGIYPLCYSNPQPGVLVFGSTTDSVRAHPAVGATVRPQAIYDYFYFIDRVPAPETIYQEQMKLPPGHALRFAKGEVRVQHYWRMPYGRGKAAGEDELADQLLQRLRQAVSATLKDEDPERVGAFLSGGLDSSAVLGLLAERVPKAKSFTIGFSAEGFDETPYAKLAARHFDSRHEIYTLRPEDVLAAIPKIGEIYDEPFANSSAVPAYLCALRAKEAGIEVMLAGDGGDEIFAGNSRYLRDAVFDRYRLIPKALRQGLIEPLVSGLPGWLRRVPLARKLPNYVDLATKSVAERLTGDNLYQALDPAEIFADEILSEISLEAPMALVRAIYDEAPSEAKLHRMMYLDLRITLADSDIRKVNRMCELAGLRVRYPMLDDDLVAFSATVPPEFHMADGNLRAFYKKAVSGLLPSEILAKEKKGFGLPYMELLAGHRPLAELACDSLQSLKARGCFRNRFLDEVTDDLNAGTFGRFGGVAWDLIMLEKWFETRMTSSAIR